MELLWWLATAILLAGLLSPIYKTQAVYPFWQSNAIFILVFITLTRYFFLLKHTFLAYAQWAKAFVFVGCIPLVLLLVGRLTEFTTYVDQTGLESMFEHLSLKGQSGMANYVRNEMLFFGAGSVIISCLMPVRMLISFWRTHNRGTV